MAICLHPLYLFYTPNPEYLYHLTHKTKENRRMIYMHPHQSSTPLYNFAWRPRFVSSFLINTSLSGYGSTVSPFSGFSWLAL